MKIKNLIGLLAVLAVSVSAVGCNDEEPVENVAETQNVGNALAQTAVSEAVESLKGRGDTYLISTEMRLPESQLYYIEIIDKETGNAWTEYPVDKDGNLGTISFLKAEDTQYQLLDWWDASGNSYTYQVSSENKSKGIWYRMPTKHSERVVTRNVMYLDVLTENAYEYNEGTISELEDGSEIRLYTCKVPSEDVAEVMSLDSLSIYDGLLYDAKEKKDENAISLCNKYIEDLSMNFVYSEGLLTIQMVDGVITGMSLEAGGLGTRMYVTKTIAGSGNSVEKREVPDFSNATEYYASMKELADYVAQYGSYEEAMIALSQQASGLEQEVAQLETTEGTLPTEEAGAENE